MKQKNSYCVNPLWVVMNVKSKIKKIFIFFLIPIFKLINRFPWIKSAIARVVQKFPLLAVQLRALIENQIKNQAANQLPPLLRDLSLTVRNIYIPLQTAVTAKPNSNSNKQRLKLAYVSPMPPEQTGIADYSAQLLPALAQYYDIEIISQGGSNARTPQWLCENLHQIDRVLYHFGNSFFHSYMVELIEKIPGVVVLHDFFLSGLYAYLDYSDKNHSWTKELYHAHGYSAVLERYIANDPRHLQIKYPVNLSILQRAKGVIVHSQYSKQLARQWYGENFSQDWQVISMLNMGYQSNTRESARRALGFKDTDFLICSFGFLGPTKLNHRLLNAWLSSNLLQDRKAILIFVGQSSADIYNKELQDIIDKHHSRDRVHITGWIDKTLYSHYLSAADLAVQLRGQSRGETSAAVYECMSYALPTIANANGAFSELPPNAVWLLQDDFMDVELIQALETLYLDKNRRLQLSKCAQEVIKAFHSPGYCADLYAKAIENFYLTEAFNPVAMVKSLIQRRGRIPASRELIDYAKLLAPTLTCPSPFRQLLVDVSATHRRNLKTGIERTVEKLISELLKAEVPGYRVEPVYLCMEEGGWVYRYANDFTLSLLGCPQSILLNDMVEVQQGDVLFTLDIASQILTKAVDSGLHSRWQARGVKIYSLVYDLLPVLLSQVFPDNLNIHFRRWLETISQFDGAICISKTTAAALTAWREKNSVSSKLYSIAWAHLGADILNSKPGNGISPKLAHVFQQLSQRPTFLMVGTIEPRKNYLQVIQAFSSLWDQGFEGNLIIAGKEGWRGVPAQQRRDIIKTIGCLRTHPQMGRRLFWLEDASDEYLEEIYNVSCCLIAASLDEGFGLPLIEAARHHLPIIARDLPVFREIGGEHIYYFKGTNATDLADAIQAWLTLYGLGKHPDSKAINWLTWKQSAANILDILMPSLRS